jgi:ankyrin repeat protein/beta-lactamase regulating signal transducer with metallopeptidase domain
MIEQLNSIAGAWWSWMWPMFWQVSVLIALIGAADFALRKHIWPQVRYALWLLVLVKLILPPTFSLSTGVVSYLRPLAEQAVVRQESRGEFPAVASLREDLTLAEPVADMASKPVPISQQADVLAPANDVSAIDIAAAAGVVKPSWHVYVMSAWLLGALILAAWLIARFRQLRAAHRNKLDKADLPAWLEKLLVETAKKLNLKRLPEVVISQSVSCPAVFGVVRPVLLLPNQNISQISRKDTEHILLHELAHIKRGDLWVHGAYMMLQIIYWFNPLLWFVRRKLQHLRELCCDATVAGILREKTADYRETILQTAKWLLDEPKISGIGILGLVERPSRLIVRLNWLEKKTWRYQKMKKLTVITVAVLMITFVLPMAKAQKPEKDDTSLAIEHERKSVKSLHQAGADGDIEQVKLHISIDTPINAKDRGGRTALHSSASKGYTEIARLLIAKGADVNARDEDDWTPLHYAAKNGHKDVAEVLIAKGADINARDRWLGWRPIHRAARSGHKEIVELLLANGVDVNSGSYWFKQTAAEYAMDVNRNEIVELLISKGADISPLHFALHMKDRAKARSLIEGGADVNKRTRYGTSPLHMAAGAGLKDIAELLIDKGANVNAADNRGRTPLHNAAEKGYKEIVELLLAQGADVNAGARWNRSAAEFAMRGNHNEIVELLISCGLAICYAAKRP